MRDDTTLAVRYVGADHSRRYLIQRGDGEFWTGEGFSGVQNDAELFADKQQVQGVLRSIMFDKYRNKPMRTYQCEVTFTVIGDDVETMDPEVLNDFLFKSIVLNIDTGAHGNGPIPNTYVLPQIKLAVLNEIPRPRRLF